ncbi:phosphatase [Niameybacter massiliensis]|uniref:Phosphatase n=1 Tax=Holtiella tumoricola TaxID=3018743 RepID=A0AA42DJN0_9FIRM|nr:MULTISPECIES: phosphatase [Lachnospirales]MDA3730237.1 phosphatase [Holtiella tumoricola]
MKLLTDMHIHTVSSGHAYSTVDEIARFAGEKELKIIAITDHNSGLPGGAHDFHFHNLKAIPRQLYGVTVLRGMEANIIDFDGNIDATEDTLGGLDFTIASMHPPCLRFGDKEEVTRAMIGAMENPFVKILGHPGDDRYPFDHEAVVLAAKRTGTILEVNNASLKPGGFRPGVRENLISVLGLCKQYNVPVMANTDAHIAYAVGEFEESIRLFEEVDFPQELILNLHPERILDFIALKN